MHDGQKRWAKGCQAITGKKRSIGGIAEKETADEKAVI
jgi:hypothetical protein